MHLMSDTHKPKCDICNGPHNTKTHSNWVEKSDGMTREKILNELKKYGKAVEAMQSGGLNAAEIALNDIGLTMHAGTCFCGTPNHTSADHLRWLADKKTEL